MDCSMPGLLSITNSQNLLKFMSIESVMPSNHLILCHPLLLPPSIFPSIRVFSSESVLRIRWPKYWNFSFSISPSSEYSGLNSFRMDWFDLLVVQDSQESSLSLHSSNLCYSRLTVSTLCSWKAKFLTFSALSPASHPKHLLSMKHQGGRGERKIGEKARQTRECVGCYGCSCVALVPYLI